MKRGACRSAPSQSTHVAYKLTFQMGRVTPAAVFTTAELHATAKASGPATMKVVGNFFPKQNGRQSLSPTDPNFLCSELAG